MFAVSFLNKVQTIETKIESPQLRSTSNHEKELKSNRESFKQPSLFSKGPIVAHHRSLALSSMNKDRSQNISVIQNQLTGKIVITKQKTAK